MVKFTGLMVDNPLCHCLFKVGLIDINSYYIKIWICSPKEMCIRDRIKSLAFTTDVAVIKNINADAIIAVYPFTPQPAITSALAGAARALVIAG